MRDIFHCTCTLYCVHSTSTTYNNHSIFCTGRSYPNTASQTNWVYTKYARRNAMRPCPPLCCTSKSGQLSTLCATISNSALNALIWSNSPAPLPRELTSSATARTRYSSPAVAVPVGESWLLLLSCSWVGRCWVLRSRSTASSRLCSVLLMFVRDCPCR